MYSGDLSLSHKWPMSLSNVTSSEKPFLPTPPIQNSPLPAAYFPFFITLHHHLISCYLLLPTFSCLNTPSRGKHCQGRGLVCLALCWASCSYKSLCTSSLSSTFPQLFILLASSHSSSPSSYSTFSKRPLWPLHLKLVSSNYCFHQGLQLQAIKGDSS